METIEVIRVGDKQKIIVFVDKIEFISAIKGYNDRVIIHMISGDIIALLSLDEILSIIKEEDSIPKKQRRRISAS